jgi:hypothetical protein
MVPFVRVQRRVGSAVKFINVMYGLVFLAGRVIRTTLNKEIDSTSNHFKEFYSSCKEISEFKSINEVLIYGFHMTGNTFGHRHLSKKQYVGVWIRTPVSICCDHLPHAA